MAFAPAKRFSRQELKKPDEFVTATARIYNFILDHRKAFVLGTLVAVVVIGGLWGYRALDEHKALEASNALTEAIKVWDAEVKGETKSEEKPDDTAKEKRLSFPTDHERLKAALAKFDEVRAKHPGTRVAVVAWLYAGRCHLGIGGEAGLQAALGAFQKFLADSDPKEPLRFVALEAIGYAYEDLKRYDEAVARFQEYANHDAGRLAGHRHVARVLIAQKKYKEAKEALERAKVAATAGTKPGGAIHTSEIDSLIAQIEFWHLDR